jgi:RNA polymerase sigma-70 factor (ECF subfamily)
MEHRTAELAEHLGRWRSYLRTIARLKLDPRLRAKLDASDVVQDVLARAWEKIEQFRGGTPGELKAWLRQILTTGLAEAVRKWTRPGRDVGLERALLQAVERSSQRLEEYLSDQGLSPDQQAQREEQLLRLAEALETLPDDQRLAVEMMYFDGLPLGQIAEVMGRTPQSVSRALRKGEGSLRRSLGSWG